MGKVRRTVVLPTSKLYITRRDNSCVFPLERCLFRLHILLKWCSLFFQPRVLRKYILPRQGLDMHVKFSKKNTSIWAFVGQELPYIEPQGLLCFAHKTFISNVESIATEPFGSLQLKPSSACDWTNVGAMSLRCIDVDRALVQHFVLLQWRWECQVHNRL